MTLKNLYDAFKIFSDLKSLNDNIFKRGTDNLANASTEVVNIYNSVNDISDAFSSGGFKSGVKALGNTISSLVSAHPVLISLAAVLGSIAVAQYGAEKNLRNYENAANAIGDYKNTQAEIENVNSELDETRVRIDELNAKKSLSLVEQGELEKLKQTNDELERQQKILDTEEKGRFQSAYNAAKNYFTSVDDNDSHDHPWYVDAFGGLFANEATNGYLSTSYRKTNGVAVYDRITNIEGANQHLERVKELKAEQEDLYNQLANMSYNDTGRKDIEKQIDENKTLISDYEDWLSEEYNKWGEVTDNFNQDIIELLPQNVQTGIVNFQKEYDAYLGTTESSIQSKLSGIFEIQELKDADTQQALVDYVNALKDVSEFDINSGSLNSVKGIERLRTALSEADIEADDLYQYLKAIADDGSYDLDEVGKQLRESITNAILSSDKKADKEITQWVVDNWANDLSEDELTAVANIKANPEVDTSQWDIDTWRNQIQQYFNDNPVSIDVVLEDFNSKIDDIQSVYSTLANAVKEYNEYGAYTLDTLQSLLALEPEYLAMLVTENGQLGINKDTMIQLINTQIEDAKTKLYQAAARDINTLSVSNESENLQDNTENLNDNTTATYENTVAKAAQNALSRGVSQEDINEVWNRYSPLIDNLNNFQSNLQSNLSYALGGGSTASDASEKIADIQRQIDELEESIALDELKYKFDSLEQSITKVDNALSLLNDISDLTYENDYIGKIELTTEQMDLAQSKAELLANEFKELQDEEYNSGDQAAELASRIFYAIIHSDMYENIYLNAGNS